MPLRGVTAVATRMEYDGDTMTTPRRAAEPALPVKRFADDRAFEAWLVGHHDRSNGLWLKLAKKAGGQRSVTYAEALDVALCYGWIDGRKQALDERYWLQKFTPRGPRSRWSQINCGKAQSLIDSGRMQPAGMVQVERARADGRWENAYASPKSATVPEDLQAALDAAPQAARDFFAELESHNRYAILYRVQDAKRPQTRKKRIDDFVQMLLEGRTLHPRKRMRK